MTALRKAAEALAAATFVDDPETAPLLAALRAALAEAPEDAPGEGGPCLNCGVPWTATASDVAWDGPRDHAIGAAECPRCQYPALVTLDPWTDRPAASQTERESAAPTHTKETP